MAQRGTALDMKDDPRRPNLFIIGAMKSGTSSLHAYLDAHPEIFMSRQKEPGYFLKEFTWGRGEDWYLSLFDGGESCRYRGESSTHYTKLPRFQGAAERLAEHCPDARLIYLMRDPIERIISHYWHMVMSHDEDRPMLEAVQRNPQYLHVSNYPMQLEPWFARFPRDRILTMTFEALVADPDTRLREIFSWLGVDPDFTPENCGRSYNAGAARFVKPRGEGWLNRLRFSRFWDVASRVVPAPVRALGRRLAEREFDRSREPIEPVIEHLRPRVLPWIHELESLLGREFPEWATSLGQPFSPRRAGSGD